MTSTVEDAESELLARAREGDRAAFDRLVLLFGARLRGFLGLRVRDVARIDDLAQETFLAAYRKLDQFDPALPFWPWLRGIAQYALLNERRIRRADPLDDTLHALCVEEADRLEALEVSEAIADCLETLPPASRRLVDGRYRDGLPIDGLARREGRGAKAVSVALVRIRIALRDCLERRLPGGAP